MNKNEIEKLLQDDQQYKERVYMQYSKKDGSTFLILSLLLLGVAIFRLYTFVGDISNFGTHIFLSVMDIIIVVGFGFLGVLFLNYYFKLPNMILKMNETMHEAFLKNPTVFVNMPLDFEFEVVVFAKDETKQKAIETLFNQLLLEDKTLIKRTTAAANKKLDQQKYFQYVNKLIKKHDESYDLNAIYLSKTLRKDTNAIAFIKADGGYMPINTQITVDNVEGFMPVI